MSGQGGYPGTNSIANGILVGPGGPTGIIGRPYGGLNNFNQQGGFGNYPGVGFSLGPQGGHGFDGQHNGIGPQFGGSPYSPQFGGPGQGFPGPLFEPANNKDLQVKKDIKSLA